MYSLGAAIDLTIASSKMKRMRYIQSTRGRVRVAWNRRGLRALRATTGGSEVRCLKSTMCL